jgi:hypothetical protein
MWFSRIEKRFSHTLCLKSYIGYSRHVWRKVIVKKIHGPNRILGISNSIELINQR